MSTKSDSEPSQAEKFANLARKLECDEDEAAFDERLKKLATAKPGPEKPGQDAG